MCTLRTAVPVAAGRCLCYWVEFEGIQSVHSYQPAAPDLTRHLPGRSHKQDYRVLAISLI